MTTANREPAPPGMLWVADTAADGIMRWDDAARLITHAEAQAITTAEEAEQVVEHEALVAELLAMLTPDMTPEQIVRLVLDEVAY